MIPTINVHKATQIAMNYLYAFLIVTLTVMVILFIVLGGGSKIHNAVTQGLSWINNFFGW